MLELLTDPAAWLSFATLTVLEIVLGIDNIVFLSVLVAKLPVERQERARMGGLALAMITRIGLLFSITWLASLRAPLFEVYGRAMSGRGLVLLVGGLFLLWKAVLEIHETVEGPGPGKGTRVVGRAGVIAVMLQIALIDIVFSIDSVFTAVGLASEVAVMVAAIVIAVLVMMFVSRGISDFIARHPTVKVLALAFLLLIGVALVADGLDFHIPRGYLYFAMTFSLIVEMLNLRARKTVGNGGPTDPQGRA
jgi:predicted tellurium resistance membrane protein TerC